MNVSPNEARELVHAVAYWQDLLRLASWSIYAKWVHLDDIAGANAQIKSHLNSKKAALNVAVRSDFHGPDEVGIDFDLDRSITHELFHLHARPFANPDCSVAEEQAAWAIAEALASLKRRGDDFKARADELDTLLAVAQAELAAVKKRCDELVAERGACAAAPAPAPARARARK